MHQQKCEKEKVEQERIKGLSNIRAGCTNKSMRKTFGVGKDFGAGKDFVVGKD